MTVNLLEWQSELDARNPWRQFAACRGKGPEIFFAKNPRAAKKICATCSVKLSCEAYNDEYEEIVGWRSGVYGGRTASEREAEARLRYDQRVVMEERV